jgi:hypothetical protein
MTRIIVGSICSEIDQAVLGKRKNNSILNILKTKNQSTEKKLRKVTKVSESLTNFFIRKYRKNREIFAIFYINLYENLFLKYQFPYNPLLRLKPWVI